MILVERDQNVRIAGSGHAVIQITQRNAAARNADIIQNSGELPGGDHVPDHGFDAVHEPRGFFDPGSAGGADMKPELARVNGRKKVLPKLRDQHPGAHAKGQKNKHKEDAMGEHRAQKVPVSFPESVETAFKNHMQSCKRAQPQGRFTCAGRMASIDVAVEPHHQGRDEGPGKHIACQHGKNDRFGHRHEKIARHAG